MTFLQNKSYKCFDNDKAQHIASLIIILRAQPASTKWLSPKIFKISIHVKNLRKFKNKLNDNQNSIYLYIEDIR